MFQVQNARILLLRIRRPLLFSIGSTRTYLNAACLPSLRAYYPAYSIRRPTLLARLFVQGSHAAFSSQSSDGYSKLDKTGLKSTIDAFITGNKTSESNSDEQGRLLLIDVREPEEIEALGPVEYNGVMAENIHLHNLDHAFQMTEEEFEDMYGFAKPNKETDHLIFSCRSGVRSDFASRTAVEHGYKHVANYTGGALDWFDVKIPT